MDGPELYPCLCGDDDSDLYVNDATRQPGVDVIQGIEIGCWACGLAVFACDQDEAVEAWNKLNTTDGEGGDGD